MKLIITNIIIICAILVSACASSAEDLMIEAEKLENQEKFSEAIPLLDQAIKKNPNLLGAFINRGADYAALGNYEKAIENYKIVL